MNPTLPAAPKAPRSLTDVAAECLTPDRRSRVLIVIDGLGMHALRQYAAHARHLSKGITKADTALSVAPSTTASAITSILTGAAPGQHGVIGYSAFDPTLGRPRNNLQDWGGVDVAAFQPIPTIFERHTAAGSRAFAVVPPHFVGSGFTEVSLRGAELVGEPDVALRVERAYALAREHSGALVYCYFDAVDHAGHGHGLGSPRWLAALEDVDAAVSAPIPRDVLVTVTSDHGMVNVPEHRHDVIEPDDARFEGVAWTVGEPRFVQVYVQPDANIDDVARVWAERCGDRADVLTRETAIARGLFGTVRPDVISRIGDVLAIARGNNALYDGRDAAKQGRMMVGQHGALSAEERLVPYLRWA